jgi:hypothetical protein
MSSWSCTHDLDGVCQEVRGARCDPGMRGCVRYGRFRFAKDEGGGMRKASEGPACGAGEAQTPVIRLSRSAVRYARY